MEKKIKLQPGLDRLSNLPDPIRAQILSLLPVTQAIRTSILSSTWRALSSHMLTLDLSSSKLPKSLVNGYFTGLSNEDRVKKKDALRGSFYEFIDREFESVLMLQKVNLYVPGFGPELICRVDNWVGCALRYPLVEFGFDLGTESWDGPKYSLPKAVFSSNLIRKLTLQKCEVKESSLGEINLPFLNNLRLESVLVNDEAMEKFLANCPNLEYFTFEYCIGLERLEIIGHDKLKSATVQYRYEENLAIEIQAPNLLEFTYECENFHDNEGFCEVQLYDCPKVKKFIARGTAMDDMDLNSLLEGFPVLEHLELHHCDCLRYLQISNPELVYLELQQCQWTRKAEINAPKLKTFYYEDDDPIPLPLRGTAPKLKDATVYLKPGDKEEKYYYPSLVKFFAKLRHCDRLAISVGFEEDLIVPHKVRMKTSRPPLSGVKHLVIQHRSSFKDCTLTSFIEGLMWLAPCPESISIAKGFKHNCKLLEFTYEKPLKSQKKCGCWKSLSVHCWRHSLTKVTIKNNTRNGHETEIASFFRNARIDGKIVECSVEISPPEPKTKRSLG